MKIKTNKIIIYLVSLLAIGIIIITVRLNLTANINYKKNKLLTTNDKYVVWKVTNIKKYMHATNNDQETINNILETVTLNRHRSDILTETGIAIIDIQKTKSNITKDERNNILNNMRLNEEKNAAMQQMVGKNQADLIKTNADNQANLIITKAKNDAAMITTKHELIATKIYDNAYKKNPRFYNFYRSMQAYKHAFNNKKTTIIMNPEGQFFKYFNRDQ